MHLFRHIDVGSVVKHHEGKVWSVYTSMTSTTMFRLLRLSVRI